MLIFVSKLKHIEVEYNRHLGQSKPTLDSPEEKISMIQADGDELQLIRRQFSNIPMTTDKVVLWKGEAAQFIYDNIKLQ